MTAAPEPRPAVAGVDHFTAQRAPGSKWPSRELLALWRQHGGDWHGPRVETVTMPMYLLTGFLEAAAQVRQAERDAEVERLGEKLIASEKREAMLYEIINAHKPLGLALQRTRQAAVAEARASKAVERVKVLEEALRPFAKAGELFPPREPDGWDMIVYKPAAGPDYEIYGDHLRVAAALLSTTPDLGGDANDTTGDGGGDA